MITQKMVAERVGLDVSSVNKILIYGSRPGSKFRKDTVARVRKTAREMGYVFSPNGKAALIEAAGQLFYHCSIALKNLDDGHVESAGGVLEAAISIAKKANVIEWTPKIPRKRATIAAVPQAPVENPVADQAVQEVGHA